MKFRSFDELLRRNAAERADCPAFVFAGADGGTVTVSHSRFYADVLQRKAEIAALSEGAVAIYQVNSYSWVRDMFASVLAGRQTVLIDPSVEGALLQKVAVYADVAHILDDAYTAEEAAAVKLSGVVTPTAEGEGDLLFFTSGTTGASKAVVLTSRNMCASAWNGNDKLVCRPDDNLLAMLPFSHVFGFVC